MKQIVKIILIMIFFNLRSFVFADVSGRYGEKKYIFSYSAFFKSNLVDVAFIDFSSLYMIISNKSDNIDLMMLELSKKKTYTSEFDILDTLSHYFKIYNVIRDTSKNKGDDILKIEKNLTDYNNYKNAYLYFLDDTVSKHSVLNGFIIYRYRNINNIKYQVINGNYDSAKICPIIITELR